MTSLLKTNPNPNAIQLRLGSARETQNKSTNLKSFSDLYKYMNEAGQKRYTDKLSERNQMIGVPNFIGYQLRDNYQNIRKSKANKHSTSNDQTKNKNGRSGNTRNTSFTHGRPLTTRGASKSNNK